MQPKWSPVIEPHFLTHTIGSSAHPSALCKTTSCGSSDWIVRYLWNTFPPRPHLYLEPTSHQVWTGSSVPLISKTRRKNRNKTFTQSPPEQIRTPPHENDPERPLAVCSRSVSTAHDTPSWFFFTMHIMSNELQPEHLLWNWMYNYAFIPFLWCYVEGKKNERKGTFRISMISQRCVPNTNTSKCLKKFPRSSPERLLQLVLHVG